MIVDRWQLSATSCCHLQKFDIFCNPMINIYVIILARFSLLGFPLLIIITRKQKNKVMKIQITKQGFFLLFVYRYIIFGFDLIISILHLQRAKIPESVSNSTDNISKRKNWRESKKKNMLIFKINKPMKVFWYSLLHVLQIYSPDNFRTKNGDFCGICGPNWFHLSKVTVPLVMHNSKIVLHSGAVNVHFRHGSV